MMNNILLIKLTWVKKQLFYLNWLVQQEQDFFIMVKKVLSNKIINVLKKGWIKIDIA